LQRSELIISEMFFEKVFHEENYIGFAVSRLFDSIRFYVIIEP
jgi:hypothetical protein